MSVHQRVLDAVRAAPKPVAAAVLARRLGAKPPAVKAALQRLRVAGLIMRAPGYRWAPSIPGAAPEQFGTPRFVLALDVLRSMTHPMTTAQVAGALNVPQRVAAESLRRLVARGVVACSIDSATGSHRWSAVRLRPAQHVASVLAAATKPLQARWLARRVSLSEIEVTQALTSLQARGLAVCEPDGGWLAVRETGRRAPNAEAVLEALATASGPLITAEISDRTGLTQRQAETAVRRLETMKLAQADNEQTRGRFLLWRATRFSK